MAQGNTTFNGTAASIPVTTNAKPLPSKPTTIKLLPTTITTTTTPTTFPNTTNDKTVGIGIGFGILAVLLLIAIMYACFLYKRLMRTAQQNRRTSNLFSKLSRKKTSSNRVVSTIDSRTGPASPGGPQRGSSSNDVGLQAKRALGGGDAKDDKSIYLDMRSSETKYAERPQQVGYVNQGGPADNPPIYDTVSEAAYVNIKPDDHPPTYRNFDGGEDNPIYENLDKNDTSPLYINITPSVTPTPSPSHSPRAHKAVQQTKSSEYMLMSNPGSK